MLNKISSQGFNFDFNVEMNILSIVYCTSHVCGVVSVRRVKGHIKEGKDQRKQ